MSRTRPATKSAVFFNCASPSCGRLGYKWISDVRRARKNGCLLFCSQACSGDAHRIEGTDEERRARKIAYDAEYRRKNRDHINAGKHIHYLANHDRMLEEQAERRARPGAREQQAAYHHEWIRRPKVKAAKQKYDRRYRAERNYGEFAGAFLALQDLQTEIDSQMTRTEI